MSTICTVVIIRPGIRAYPVAVAKPLDAAAFTKVTDLSIRTGISTGSTVVSIRVRICTCPVAVCFHAPAKAAQTIGAVLPISTFISTGSAVIRIVCRVYAFAESIFGRVGTDNPPPATIHFTLEPANRLP